MTVAKEEVTITQRLLWVTNTIFHQVVAIVAIFVLWISFKNYDIDNTRLWHIVLSTAAYVPLMAEGVILFSGDNVWTLRAERTIKYWVHGVLLGISCLAVTIGIAYETHAKRQSGRTHFVSDHAITGLVSWVLAFVSILLGLSSWHAQRLKGLMRPVIFKFIHNFIGIGSYTIGIASLCLGFRIPSFARLLTENELETTIALVIIVTVWSLLAALKSGYNQLKNVFS